MQLYIRYVSCTSCEVMFSHHKILKSFSLVYVYLQCFSETQVVVRSISWLTCRLQVVFKGLKAVQISLISNPLNTSFESYKFVPAWINEHLRKRREMKMPLARHTGRPWWRRLQFCARFWLMNQRSLQGKYWKRCGFPSEVPQWITAMRMCR